MRRFSDSVQVRLQVRQQEQKKEHEQKKEKSGALRPFEAAAGRPPAAFIWRGRLYVVRGVLAHWRERRAWWHDALDAEEAQVRPGETLVAAASEQHVWRVEASPGWSFAPGVYDLAHDESPRGDQWSLVRVAD